MPIKTVEAAEYTCDACGKQETFPVVDGEANSPGWFKVDVEWNGLALDLVACKKACVAKALAKVTEKGSN